MRPNWIALGALSGALAVILGAFGAHGLKDRISSEDLDIWRTGVLYEALHAAALVLFGLFQDRRRTGSGPGWAFLSGSLVFSGTLYAIALGGPRALGAITPVGGLLLIAGWLGFAVQALRSGKASGSSGES